MGSSHVATAELRQGAFASRKKVLRKTKTFPKSTTIAAYTGVFLLVMSMIAIGYQPPQKIDSVANTVNTVQPNNPTGPQPSVDQLVATSVAANIAANANLSIAPNVANLSTSLSAESQLAQSNDNVISKPQIIQPTAGSRAIKTYTTKAGDTVEQIAQTYGLTPDTIKWANNLVSDALDAGKQLTIPPVDGVVYTVQGTDTLQSIASKFQANADQIVAFNDLELSGVSAGKTIIIPGGILPVDERPGYVSPQNAASQGAYLGGFSTINAQIAQASAGNRYAFGNCTWYAYERRVQLGLPVGSFWGNASTWAINARAAGLRVDNVPEVGAIAQWNAYANSEIGYAGHVAIVERIDSDGSLTVSEMNYAGNFDRVTSRTLSAGSVSNFIH